MQVKSMFLRRRWSHCTSHLEIPAAHGALHKQTDQLWSQQGDEGMPAAVTDISTGLQLSTLAIFCLQWIDFTVACMENRKPIRRTSRLQCFHLLAPLAATHGSEVKFPIKFSWALPCIYVIPSIFPFYFTSPFFSQIQFKKQQAWQGCYPTDENSCDWTGK